MDVLSDVLRLLRLKGCVYFVQNFAGPWGMEMDPGPFAQFHLVVRGQCWMATQGGSRQLSSGDVVVFPFGAEHRLSDTANGSTIPGIQVLHAVQAGEPVFDDGEESVRLLCGHFEFDQDTRHPLIGNLPDVIHIKAMAQRHPDWLDAVTNILVHETGSDRPGAATVVDRLAEVLFVQILRAYWLDDDLPSGFLAGLSDRGLSEALKFIHERVHEPVTLAGIAAAAGMSRSSLANRFKDGVGVTPIGYLTLWRMLKGRDLLKTSGESLDAVAAAVGYASREAFTRAFRRQFDQSPGAFRRTSGKVSRLGGPHSAATAQSRRGN